DGDGDGRVVAEDDHPQRIAHQNEWDASGLHQRSHAIVIGRQHDDALTIGLHRHDLIDAHAHGGLPLSSVICDCVRLCVAYANSGKISVCAGTPVTSMVPSKMSTFTSVRTPMSGR